MQESVRLTGFSSGFELEFVEREATPEPAMKLGIQLHAAGLSDTVSVLAGLGVDRARSTVHNWVQKAGLQPTDGKSPNHVALDETVIQLNNERFWLYAAVDPHTNEFLHVRLSHQNDRPHKTVSPRTHRETRRRQQSVSRRQRTVAQSCTLRAKSPISNRHTWKSECCRTTLQRTQTTHRLLRNALAPRNS